MSPISPQAHHNPSTPLSHRSVHRPKIAVTKQLSSTDGTCGLDRKYNMTKHVSDILLYRADSQTFSSIFILKASFGLFLYQTHYNVGLLG